MAEIQLDERTVYDAILPVFQSYQEKIRLSVEEDEVFQSAEFQQDVASSLLQALQELSAGALMADLSWLNDHFVGLLSDQVLKDIEDVLTETLSAYSSIRANFSAALIASSTVREVFAARERFIRDNDNEQKSWMSAWMGVARAAAVATAETTALFSFATKAMVSVFAGVTSRTPLEKPRGKSPEDQQVVETPEDQQVVETPEDPGIEAIWETMQDERVRESHRALQGASMSEWSQVYPYGPSPGSEEAGHSGWGCRCRLRLVETDAESMTNALGYTGWRSYIPDESPRNLVLSLSGMEDV